jgi:murein DD-endopeptidase MepM/ murein hydrolase activator NlpD
MNNIIKKSLLCVIMVMIIASVNLSALALDYPNNAISLESESQDEVIRYEFTVDSIDNNIAQISLNFMTQNSGDLVELVVVDTASPDVLIEENTDKTITINVGETYKYSLRVTRNGKIYSYDGSFNVYNTDSPHVDLKDVYYSVTDILPTVSLRSTLSNVYESESNDSYSQADVINNEDNVYGSLMPTTDTQDWYRIQFSQSGYVNLFLGNIPSGCNYNLALYSSDGTTLLTSSSTAGNANELIRAYSVQANTNYYIRVNAATSQGSISNYLLRVKRYDTAYGALEWSYFFTDTSIRHISNPFGPSHYGFDIVEQGGDITGTTIKSVTSGEARFIYLNTGSGGYGISIRTNSTDPLGSYRLWTTYYHMEERPKKANGTNWAYGDSIAVGDRLGTVGNTGTSTGAHLHFKVNNNDSYDNDPNYLINPVYFFPQIAFTSDSRALNSNITDSIESADYNDCFIEIRLVDYVGEANCLEWINNTPGVKDINDFREYFNITDDTFIRLCDEFEGLNVFYDVNDIIGKRSIQDSTF